MSIKAGSLYVGHFFSTADQTGNNRILIMRVVPTALDDGLCQDIKDMKLWSITEDRDVRRVLNKDQYKSEFYV